MLFVPASSPAYGGYHWAVYDETHSFYSYDDGDTTAGGIALLPVMIR